MTFYESLIEKNQYPKKQSLAWLGDCLKQKRLDKGMNLEEATDGIVAPSYLSKVENNDIKGSPESLKLLAERVGLPITVEEDQPDNVTVNDGILSAIELFYDQNIDGLKALKKATVDPLFVSSHTLMEGFIAVLEKRLFVSKEIVEALWPRFDALSFHDHLALSLLALVQAYHMKKYDRGFKMISLISKVNVASFEYHFLMNYYGYLTAEAAEKPHVAKRLYDKACELASSLIQSKYTAKMYLTHLQYLNREDPEYVYESCMKASSFKVTEELINMKTLLCMNNALDLGRHCPTIQVNEAVMDDAFYEIKLLQAMKYKQFDDAAFEKVSHFQLIYKKVYELSKLEDPKQRATFIRHDVLPILKEVYMPDMARMLYHELAEFQRSINRYKEAESNLRQLAKYLGRIEHD